MHMKLEPVVTLQGNIPHSVVPEPEHWECSLSDQNLMMQLVGSHGTPSLAITCKQNTHVHMGRQPAVLRHS